MTATRGRHTSLGLQLSVLAAKRTNGVGKNVMSSGCLKCSARHVWFVISQEIKISGKREAPRQAPEGPFPPPPGLTSHAYSEPLGDAWIFLKFHLFPHVRVAVPLAPQGASSTARDISSHRTGDLGPSGWHPAVRTRRRCFSGFGQGSGDLRAPEGKLTGPGGGRVVAACGDLPGSHLVTWGCSSRFRTAPAGSDPVPGLPPPGHFLPVSF